MDNLKRSEEARKGRAFGAFMLGELDKNLLLQMEGLVNSLNAHKTSEDHDGRYYPRATMDGLLSAKTDKTTQILAGNGLMGGGSLHGDVGLFVGQGFGLSVDADTVGIDQSVNFDWTGEHSFGQNMRTKSILPILSDTYDLGAYNLPFRKIWGSELSAVIFSQYEQVLLGGWLTISKGEGKLPYMIDSGENAFSLGPGAFADGDILVFRGVDVDNRPQVEYMRVNNYISDDVYSVTRDLDGTGGNDWPDGTVFANWGQAGSGRIELNAQDTPRMSLYKHGANIADFAEILRIGDLNGNWGYSAPKYGMAIGAYLSGKANITQDEDGVLRIRNYNTDVIRLTGTLASFENWIQLGPTGGIRQGSGTWGSNFTGTAIWNANGYARIAGLNAGVMQWWSDNQGWLNAGAGNVFLNNNGLSLVSWLNSQNETDAVKLKWVDSETKATTLIALYNQYTLNLGNYISTLWIHSKTAIGATGFINLVADQTSVYGDLRTVGGYISSAQSVGAATSISAGTNISANGTISSGGTISEAGKRVYSPNNPQVVAFATPATLINVGSLAVNQTVDIDVTSHGVPSGSRFVLLQVDIAWGAANGLITVSRGQTAENDIIVRAPAANVQTALGIVKCRVTNNLIRFVNKNAATTTAYIRMFGYEM